MSTCALVTGGSGFVASHVIEQLLDAGYTVRTTVRSLGHHSKLQPLRDLQQQYPGRLEVFEANLLTAGAFAAAMQGCLLVFHVASPFLLPEQIKDGQRQLVEPALLGTRNVLNTVCQTPSVGRVVLTSTIGAIFGDYIDVMSMDNQTLCERYFNESSNVDNNPYHYSKVIAEREAWRICGEQRRWSMVTINPGMILGPSRTPASESGSLFLLDEMLKGYLFFGMPDLSLATVDVREVALAHLRAAELTSATGRYILAAAKMASFVEISRILRKIHKRPYLLPRHQIPNGITRVVGPLFGLSQSYMRNHLGIRFAIDNHRSIEELGITYRPLEQTLVDHYRSWAAGH